MRRSQQSKLFALLENTHLHYIYLLRPDSKDSTRDSGFPKSRDEIPDKKEEILSDANSSLFYN